MTITVPEARTETTTELQSRAARILVDFLDSDLPTACWTTPDYAPGHLVGQINRPAGPDRDDLVRAAVEEWAQVFGVPVTPSPSGVQTRTRIDGVDVRIWGAIDGTDTKDAN